MVVACVEQDGNLRWAGSLGRCRSGERMLQWSQRGPEGATAPAGERGPTILPIVQQRWHQPARGDADDDTGEHIGEVVAIG